ncbi:hypothetical protein FKP32DRAFT_1055491 [Trametes sanguinea]|nr:hypothetical protein FKP32DRAFT_1055491 [Trametes sanguinea]
MGMGNNGGGAYIRDASRDSSPSSEHFPLLSPLAIPEHEKDALPIYQTSGVRGPAPQRGGIPSLHGHAHGHTHQPRPQLPFGAGPGPQRTSSPPASRTLLPSFLQDIVHSPSLSPSSASSSSADLSFDGSSEDAHYASSTGTSVHSYPHHAGGQQQQQQQSHHQQQQHSLYRMGARNASTSSFGSLTSPTTSGGPSVSSIWRLDGEELGSGSNGHSGTSSTGPTPVPIGTRYVRHPSQSPQQPADRASATDIPTSSRQTGGGGSPRASDATPKSTNDFWQVRYN